MEIIIGIIIIVLYVGFSVISIAVALGGGLFIGIFPAVYWAIKNYIMSVRDNVTNKFVLVFIHVLFYIFLLAMLAALGLLIFIYVLPVFGIGGHF